MGVVVGAFAALGSAAPHGDQPTLAQKSELMRRRARTEACAICELLDGELTSEQREEQPEAASGAERPHRLG